MAKTETRRLFFALCPDEQVRKKLWHLSDNVRFGRRTTIENLHITLVFLGSVNREKSKCLEQAVNEIQLQKFTLHVDQLGYWVRPKTLWAGCAMVPENLSTLVEQLKEISSSCGLFQNKKEQNKKEQKQEYVPHVSLARKVNSMQGNQYCEQHSIIDSIDWKVSQFSLMESVTYAEGPVYKVLRSW